jgi:hypothetical protein
MTPTRQSIPRQSGSTLPRMTTEYRATQPQVEDLTAVPGHTDSPTQQYLQHVGKVHAVAVVGDLEQFGTVCGSALARPTDRLFLDVPAEERCPECSEAVELAAD